MLQFLQKDVMNAENLQDLTSRGQTENFGSCFTSHSDNENLKFVINSKQVGAGGSHFSHS